MPRAPRTLDALLRDLRRGDYDPDDWTSLPTYGGAHPNDTESVWSWDATRLLVGTCRDDIRIEPRVLPESEQPGTDARWLRRSRDNLGLTQAALAERLGLAANTVARIERGELPLTRVTRLAVAALAR